MFLTCFNYLPCILKVKAGISHFCVVLHLHEANTNFNPIGFIVNAKIQLAVVPYAKKPYDFKIKRVN